MVALKPTLFNGWRVLVVDDEPDSLLVAQSILEMYGAEVITAKDGWEGLETARTALPDFIISDLAMPQMTGWQMLHALMSTEAAHIPVIALTAFATETDRRRARKFGFLAYFTKPILRAEAFVLNLLSALEDAPVLTEKLQHLHSAGV